MSAASCSKTILLTGPNSGIGLEAAKVLFISHHKVLLVARTIEKANIAKKTILSSSTNNDDNNNSSEKDESLLVPFACDVSSFSSIRALSDELHRQNMSIDVLCLNAGMCTARNSQPEYTEEDGWEITLATNHFGPFFMTHCLFDLLNEGGRVVVTASGVHDNKKKKVTFGGFKGVTIGDDGTVTKKFPTLHGSEFDYYGAYAESKLCNVAFTLELNRRFQQDKHKSKRLVANCFCPGLITSTGLFRNQNSFFMGLFGLAANNVFGFGSTAEWGGGALAWMATNEEAGKRGGEYWKAPSGAARKGGEYGLDFTTMDVSPEANSEENQATLWKISAKIVGVDENAI
mmetsp:Transcript_12129/g.15120  ORF Transcript_12129/g.15120 Transcript_12129/m.15120 type:complete len:345 (+) Transcript_12129:121-1155(+)|eukprot:CAMPEP_0172489598 /NCGR_PEP_ID=MMETSP1066-20121228/19712_1 /TAXON_ID=671091 /ORGANISM="Coscinodiscus wailesii, Strain CCMP2513" /LENGTH=344 /DNA_ID=CAMNT_0013257575 /DNA_START=85 /DNA_END=1119 /DNA_ORIENTATION=+